ncbi:hypothetical protein SAMN05421812_12812 [Asanoa hainanensis]|uniref:Uncharacterized protein n=1 Tax=Asanoa hainanensis TaxID=560556 RepID=A0A239PFH9_9ACTN|nr:hypothetical protein [Asanoa hainanensis]SNT65866.1 hypothetical protein SAMN05421812_12812 [Asanoa hainanensis]
MTGTDRPRRLRTLARELEKRYGAPVEPTHDNGPVWRLEWTDGPGMATVRALVDAADLAGAQVRLYRSHSMMAIALTAIRLAAAGRRGRLDGGSSRSGPLWLVESELRDLDSPDRPDDPLQEVLARRLLAEATAADPGGYVDDQMVASLVRDRGLGWLLAEAAQAGAELAPLTVLSARYAPHADADHAVAWRERGAPLPLQAAVAAAIGDDHLSPAAAVALLSVLPDLRAGLSRTEQRAVVAARRSGLSDEAIAAAMVDPAAALAGGR